MLLPSWFHDEKAVALAVAHVPLPVSPPSRALSLVLHISYARAAMSFAGRRRGNKVKKGVQFTVMVVGQYPLRRHLMLYDSSEFLVRDHRVGCCYLLVLQVLLALDARLL